MDDATLAIAVWGAATGTIGVVVSLIVALRDRPELAASQQIVISEANSTARLELSVVNNGRRPAAIWDAGFATRYEKQGRWPRRRLMPISRTGASEGPHRPRLEPGELITITLDLITPKQTYTFDATPQGFASDTRKKVVWAKPQLSDEHLRSVYDELDRSARPSQARQG